MDLDLLATLLGKGIAQGAVYAVMGASLGIIFNVTGIFHFAHGAVFTMAAYAFYVVSDTLGLSVIGALVAAVLVAAITGAACELLMYRPLRNRKSPSLILLLGSFAVLLGIQNLLLILFGGFTRVDTSAPGGIVAIGSLTFTKLDIIKIVVSGIVVFLLFFVVYRTQLGLEFRGVISNARLTEIVGVDTRRTYLWALILGSIATVPAAVVVLWDIGVSPYLGNGVLLTASIAVFVGGIGSPLAGAVAGMAFGIVERVSPVWFPSQWQATIAIVAAVALLLVRPRGFFGVPERVA